MLPEVFVLVYLLLAILAGMLHFEIRQQTLDNFGRYRLEFELAVLAVWADQLKILLLRPGHANDLIA